MHTVEQVDIPVYRYFTVDLLTNVVLAEIPFTGVSYQRSLNAAGPFSGSIGVDASTAHLDVYNNTMPGRTALYVVRDSTCVWGGIIWSRSYNASTRTLSVNGSEFPSYLQHRKIWKTFTHTFNATLTVNSGSYPGKALITLQDGTYTPPVGSSVRVVFYEVANIQYDGYYTVQNTPAVPTSTVFYTNIAAGIPNGTYTSVTITVRTDTYDYTRALLEEMRVDFSNIDFPDGEIEPAQLLEYTVLSKKISGGLATLTLGSGHDIAPTQTVYVNDVDGQLNGQHDVATTGSRSITQYSTSAELGGTTTTTASTVETISFPTAETYQAHAYMPGPMPSGTLFGSPNGKSGGTDGYPFFFTHQDIMRPTTTGFDIAVRVDTSEAVGGGYLIRLGRNTFFALNYTLFGYYMLFDMQSVISASSTSAVPGTLLHEPIWLRVSVATVGGSLGDCSFYYSTSQTNDYDSVTWTALGTNPVSGYVSGAIDLSETSHVSFGCNNWSGLRLYAGALAVDGVTTTKFDTADAYPLVPSTAQTLMSSFDYWFDSHYSSEKDVASYNIGFGDVTGLNYPFKFNTYASNVGTPNQPVLPVATDTANVGAFVFPINVGDEWIEQPDGADISAPTVLDIRWSGSASWSGVFSALICHGSNTSYGYAFNLLSTGHLQIKWGTGATSAVDYNSTAAIGSSSTGWYALRVTVDTATTTVTFYKKETTPETAKADRESNTGWTTVSTSAAGPGAAANNSTGTLSVGRLMTTGLGFFQGTFLGADLRTTINGTIVRSFDPSLATDSSTSWTSAEAITTTVKRVTTISAPQKRSMMLVRDRAKFNIGGNAGSLTLNGVGDVMYSDPKWNQGSITVLAAVRIWNDWNTAGQTLLAWRHTSTAFGWSMRSSTTPYAVVVEVKDESSQSVTAVSPATTQGTLTVFAFVLDRVNKTLTVYANGVAGTPVSYASLGIVRSTYPVLVGKLGNSTNIGAFEAEIPFAAAPRVLTGAEISAISTAITSRDDLLPTFAASTGQTIQFAGGRVVDNTVNGLLISKNFEMYGADSHVPVTEVSAEINGFTIIGGVVSLTFYSPLSDALGGNPFSYGDVIQVSGIELPSTTETINGIFTVLSTPDDNVISYKIDTQIADITVVDYDVYGFFKRLPRVLTGTYGSFPSNSDIGIDYSTSAFSGNTFPTKDSRGYKLASVGKTLDEYTDTKTGFEFRIDCAYNESLGSFTRTFVMLPIDFPNPPAAGEVSPLTRFGADKFVFEYPGNVDEVVLDESAENAATRFFVVGNIDDLGGDASQPYAAASAVDLLNDGWPLLDADTSRNDVSEESVLYEHAARYLSEFRPPVADFKITVNGSIAPVVGTYKPGDWCAVVIDDEFVRQRLANTLEVRSDVIVRKIENVNVSVPDGVAFPERVTLNLIPEWEVDKVGQ